MKIEQQLKDLKEQNKQLLESLERHLEEKQDLRKQLYKDKVSNEVPPKHLPNGQKKIKKWKEIIKKNIKSSNLQKR